MREFDFQHDTTTDTPPATTCQVLFVPSPGATVPCWNSCNSCVCGFVKGCFFGFTEDFFFFARTLRRSWKIAAQGFVFCFELQTHRFLDSIFECPKIAPCIRYRTLMFHASGVSPIWTPWPWLCRSWKVWAYDEWGVTAEKGGSCEGINGIANLQGN